MDAKPLLGIGIVLATVVFSIGTVRSGEPTERIRDALEKGIQVLNDSGLKVENNKKERVDRLRGIVYPLFDFEEMAKRALGPHWRRRTPTERQEFVRLFTEFLEMAYADKVDLYDGEKVVFGREILDGDHAQVDSKVVNKKGQEFSVVYKLHRPAGIWKIYDVAVENISLVNNYRSQFSRVITKSSYEELVKRLKEKTS